MSNETRRHTLNQRGFVHRHPKGFILTSVAISMCIFFSKPLYDIFIAEPPPPEQAMRRTRIDRN